jgi:hypothetical protein
MELMDMAMNGWLFVRRVCKIRSPSVSGLLASAQPAGVEWGTPPTLLVGAQYQFHLEQLRDPARRQTLQWALEQVLGTPVRVRFTLTPASVAKEDA